MEQQYKLLMPFYIILYTPNAFDQKLKYRRNDRRTDNVKQLLEDTHLTLYYQN